MAVSYQHIHVLTHAYTHHLRIIRLLDRHPAKERTKTACWAWQLTPSLKTSNELCNDACGDPSEATIAFLEAALAQHPDAHFVKYILNGLVHILRIGFQHGRTNLQQVGYNMWCPEPAIISEYLSNELKLNWVIKLIKPESSSWAKARYCPRWTSNRLTGTFSSTHVIDIYLAWSGKGQVQCFFQ